MMRGQKGVRLPSVSQRDGWQHWVSEAKQTVIVGRGCLAGLHDARRKSSETDGGRLSETRGVTDATALGNEDSRT